MYQYSQHDRRQLKQRARQFQGQVRRFQRGVLHPDLFQQLRLRNGLYQERHAHMLRVAIPYGVLNSRQLTRLAAIARRFDRGYGHFTTRQNIQFNWPQLDDVPEILEQLAEVGMHAIQTSGSCVRNITADHLAGVAADEIEDPRPWCELIRQWSTLHPEFNWLPRKFKIAVSGAHADRAAVQWHDIGLRIFHDADGHTRFRVYVGGGMGRTPVIGRVIAEALPAADLLGFLQAILRVYNRYGRRDHKYRSRIKILVGDLGLDGFRERVERQWRHMAAAAPAVSEADIARARSFFTVPPVARRGGAARGAAGLQPIAVADPRFLRWREHNTAAHRDPDYRIVYVSLKAPGRAPGDLDAAQMEQLAALAKTRSAGEIRVSHEQNLALPWVRNADLFAVWHELNRLGLATPNIGTLNDMICCPGLDYCSLANAGTIGIARQINRRLADLERLYDIGEIKLKMSGCMNACGHHHAGHIGILGVDKKGAEWYQITLGGSAENDTRLGARLGPAIAREQVAEVIEIIIDAYLEVRRDGEKFLDTVIRLGVEPFKQKVYAHHQKPRRHPRPLAA
ncbi:MAG: nitrite/sulfite reductase [Gammaproteobacteria bacterium]|nr:nitrite/sulfite reductase [Gammaproteobacteria bacterium]